MENIATGTASPGATHVVKIFCAQLGPKEMEIQGRTAQVDVRYPNLFDQGMENVPAS